MMKLFRRNKRAAKVPFIILVVALSVGLVGSFTIWSVPQIRVNRAPRPVNTNPPVTGSRENDVVQKLLTNIRQYEQVLKANPDNLEVLVDLGNDHYDLGVIYAGELNQPEKAFEHFAKATEAYQKAISIDPENINVRVDLATAAFYSNQYDLAEEHFKKAIEQDPNFINARRNYGVFLAQARGDYEGAIAQWEAVLALNPSPDVRKDFEELIKQAQAELKAKQ
ncbi:tetratricopeptide repeat protein [Calderihabitans maritimus]|uniref:TPR repeat-containing protein n=1 Tax=Calderihabitans maritimus TaxID=1246530 RepID=A0A1Z5HU34_9FIRM|nr:tetratricopeptide repeat protein [Calderihabitans maritimus]GAW93046.1 TPR repeat-containing protein [Calderihabitans maritimus]